MSKRLNLYFIIIVCVFCSCKKDKAFAINTYQLTTDTITAFTLPPIPAILTTPESRADFLVNNYWKNVNFADSNYLHHSDILEQAWVDYCDLLNYVPLATAQRAMQNTIEGINQEKKVLKQVAELAEKYLYDANSPMLNEEYYIPVLQGLVTSHILNQSEKERAKRQLQLSLKNRLGTQALDFTYTLLSGNKSTLHNIQADYTLLLFNNPGCHTCAETIEKLRSSLLINKLIESKQLTVLSIYPDEEIDEWKKHYSHFPSTWINSYDATQTIRKENRYDLKAIPTLYLLDNQKKVLLKDTNVETIEKYLAGF